MFQIGFLEIAIILVLGLIIIGPARLPEVIKGWLKFYKKIQNLYQNGASVEDLSFALGRGRAKKGMFEGDLIEGELEIGQVAAQIDSIKPAAEVVQEFIEIFNKTIDRLNKIN